MSMPLLIDWSVKVAAIFAMAYVVTWMLRGKSAAIRHMIWTAATVAAMLLPIAALYLPAWETELAVTTVSVESSSAGPDLPIAAQSIQVSASRVSWLDIVLLSWVLVSSLFLLALLVGASRLAWVALHSTTFADKTWMTVAADLSGILGIRRELRFLQNNHASMLVTWGVFRPRILLPAGAEHWSEERVRVVLLHELSHIQRYDWLVQILAELARAMYWFNPLSWIAHQRLRMESENACDDAVIRSGINASDYAAHLLDLARTLKPPNRAWSPALAMARPSNLERRFLAMLNPSMNRGAATRTAVLVTTLAALMLTLPLAALRAPAQGFPTRFVGHVLDPSGAVLPGADVMISNSTAQTRDETTTDAVGTFEFSRLPGGQYELEISLPGFRIYRGNVTVQSGGAQQQTITLSVGGITEHVVLSAKGPARVNTPPTGPPQRIRVGGNVKPASLVRQTRPIYPDSLRAEGIEGKVILEGVIGLDGNLVSVRVKNTDAHPDLAQAAIDAVKQWGYSPTLLNGVPVEVVTSITVEFQLED